MKRSTANHGRSTLTEFLQVIWSNAKNTAPANYSALCNKCAAEWEAYAIRHTQGPITRDRSVFMDTPIRRISAE